MTPQQLEEIKARCEARSAGVEWTAGEVEPWSYVTALLDEVERLRGVIDNYEAPGGWRVLHDRMVRRVAGDPTGSVCGQARSALSPDGGGDE